jgi:hypothetical protein
MLAKISMPQGVMKNSLSFKKRPAGRNGGPVRDEA